MATLTHGQTDTILRRLGWRVRTTGERAQAVRNFQRGWNLGRALDVDGIVGPKTSAALRISEARRARGQSTASAHFSFNEFACRCGGRYSSCQRILILRKQIARLEGLRKAYGRPMPIVSGYRCPEHNKAAGGAARSQHMYGSASDIAYRQGWTDSRVRALKLFAGIGRSAITHLVRHVDSRDVSGHNTTNASTSHPSVWNYAR